VQSLKGRAEFENEFGAEVTMVFQRSNNPLKGLDAKDLAARLFDWSAEGGAGEQQAQLEGLLRDLTQHQLGLLGGATEAIRSVMDRLRPEAIETLAQKDAGLLTSKGAKSWEIYQKIYRELLEEKSRLFHEVISPAIRKGYLTVHEDGRPEDPNPPRG
jgi:FHA domain-containing protein